jgi:ankyrin repeat protein
VEYLVEKGASLTTQNIKGVTVLDIAKEFADPRIFLAIKAKVDLMPKPKGDAKKAKDKAKAKKKGSAKGKKKGDKPEVIKEMFLLGFCDQTQNMILKTM